MLNKGLFTLILLPFFVGAGIPDSYYKKAQGLSGGELKSALHNIIDDHKSLPYTAKGNIDWFDGKNMDVWEALTYTDSDCDAVNPKCGMVQMLYLDEARHISKANRGKGKNDHWDREHVWPKSRGFRKKSQVGYTDLHHLRPADRNINSSHSNYGYDTGGKIVYDKTADNRKMATTAKVDRANQSFEPTDKAKGQVARMIFYMAVRYELGDDGKGESMPDLTLRDANQRVKQSWIGDLCTLISWNNEYPVTNFERRRNDRVMELQGNRNPFIDHPKWANIIWESRCK